MFWPWLETGAARLKYLAMTRTICLNADIGELPGQNGRAMDRAILDVVSRCNIACGGHAGDETSMGQTLKAAKARNVIAGAHPSYPDKENFGRASMSMSAEELKDTLRQQVRTFLSIVRDIGAPVEHLKPHGALYNDAARDAGLASIIAAVAREARLNVLVGPPNSELSRAAAEFHLNYLPEGFADRRYQADGSLTPRSESGAVLRDIKDQIAQVLEFVDQGSVKVATGERIPLKVQTICLHGDTPGAIQSALELRAALHAHDIEIETPTL
ncbi:MAG: lactam utilization protein LamB [Hyphomonas sp.]|nr:lactam utilization protein LamB [Hyphomonas sp.]